MENQKLTMSATPLDGCDNSSVVIKQEPEDTCSQVSVDTHATVVIKQEPEDTCSQVSVDSHATDGSTVVIKQEPEDTCSQVSVDSHATDGSPVVIKQEPEDNCSHVSADSHAIDGRDIKELDIPVINITPTVDSIEEKCKIEDTLNVIPEFHIDRCALFETSSLPAVKCENDSNVCDSQRSTKIVRCESLETGIVQDDDQLSQLREVSGAIDCKDGINGSNDDFGAVMETGKEQRDTDGR